MEFRFTADEDRLRQEIRGFVRSELPPWWTGYEDQYAPDIWPITQEVAKKLARRGWLTMSWPREYGGLGSTVISQSVYQEETAYWGLPGLELGAGGVSVIGPCLMRAGTEEQRREHLPPTARGERYWCLCYTEPNAGSDMAALECRAEPRGDHYLVNGEKLWITAGHRADWAWVAVRSDPTAPKHKGISILLVDLHLPGVTVTPWLSMADNVDGANMVFQNARVPRTCLVGQENQGFALAAMALDYDRSGVRAPARNKKILEDLVEYVQGQPSLRHNPLIRRKLADMAIEIDACRLLAWKVAWLQNQGLVPVHETSSAKNLGSEGYQRLLNTAMQVLGLYGLLGPGSKGAVLGGRAEKMYRYAIAMTMMAGTSEIQRNTIALRGLGLPR